MNQVERGLIDLEDGTNKLKVGVYEERKAQLVGLKTEYLLYLSKTNKEESKIKHKLNNPPNYFAYFLILFVLAELMFFGIIGLDGLTGAAVTCSNI